MADLSAGEALPGLRLGQRKLSSENGLPKSGGQRQGIEGRQGFNVALADGDASSVRTSTGVTNASSQDGRSPTPGSLDPPVRHQQVVRSEISQRSDPTERSDLAARLNSASTMVAVASTVSDAEGLTAYKLDLPVLQLGSSDRTVRLLQRALAALGYLTKLTEGGFGAQTEQAVRSFQAGCGLKQDGVVGTLETWPAINKALGILHDGISRLVDAMIPDRGLAEPRIAELKQLSVLLGEFGDRAQSPIALRETTWPAASLSLLSSAGQQSVGAVTYTVREGETLSDIARAFSLPVGTLIAANSELAKPYLILQGQLLTVPNPARKQTFRRLPKQLHPADPDGHLTNTNMNPDFVRSVNGMIEQLRGEGYDVRIVAGFRSFKQQQRRFEQGRQSPGNILTDAQAGHSWHNYGLAVDIVLNDEEGQPAWPEDNARFWQRLGDVALARGDVWGGVFGYPAHIEYHPGYERNEAGSLIEDFESLGLEAIWDQIALACEEKD